MKIEELMEHIQLPEEAKATIWLHEMKEEEYEREKKAFYEDEKSFLESLRMREDRYRWALHFYLCLAAESYEKYQEQGIEDRVFYDTMSDITIWCEAWHRKTGEWGLNEVFWIGRSVKMELFRLGRLQFEPVEEGYSVHIPEGSGFTPEACMESFQMAEKFFEGGPHKYICDSWLLSPVLKEFLPEESNIIQFQNLFEIEKVHYAFPQAEQRIFGTILEDKSKYPEETSLQRKAKAYVMKGKDIGIGVGVKYR